MSTGRKSVVFFSRSKAVWMEVGTTSFGPCVVNGFVLCLHTVTFKVQSLFNKNQLFPKSFFVLLDIAINIIPGTCNQFLLCRKRPLLFLTVLNFRLKLSACLLTCSNYIVDSV